MSYQDIKKLRLSLEECKVCQDADCNGDSLQIIENACFDSLQLGCPAILPFLLLLEATISLIRFSNEAHNYLGHPTRSCRHLCQHHFQHRQQPTNISI